MVGSIPPAVSVAVAQSSARRPILVFLQTPDHLMHYTVGLPANPVTRSRYVIIQPGGYLPT
ncbi:hypothetical protein [Arthrobacter pascens]|uniref:hypothetical protein n=1 Tax=Arthrobacter pascens TaxID=1677 RepID=UPI00196B501B|nr:hypothetical protein [Arthrobacter pascens]